MQKLKATLNGELKNVEEKYYVPLFQYNINNSKTIPKLRNHTFDEFYSQCKEGDQMWRTPGINKNLSCRFQHHNNPYLKVGPFLVEQKNLRRFVALFHNLMSITEMKHFKTSGSNNLMRSGVGWSEKRKEEKKMDYTGHSVDRTSSQGWIEERIYRFPTTSAYTGKDNNGTFHMTEDMFHLALPEIPPNVQNYLIIQDIIAYGVTKRIELATQLVLDRPYASEIYQVANYGVGGQYAQHFDAVGYHTHPGNTSPVADSAMKYYSLTGDRYATFLLYLSTVELGGCTVFPLLGLNCNAVAGNAIFWNNVLSESGQRDEMSLHGGCPVLVGSKWITNKWIQYYDQFRLTPCDLKFESEKVKTFVT